MFTHTRKLPWPMSSVERDVLHSLWLESQRTGKPITEIVKNAVDEHLTRALEQQTPTPIEMSERGQQYRQAA